MERSTEAAIQERIKGVPLNYEWTDRFLAQAIRVTEQTLPLVLDKSAIDRLTAAQRIAKANFHPLLSSAHLAEAFQDSEYGSRLTVAGFRRGELLGSPTTRRTIPADGTKPLFNGSDIVHYDTRLVDVLGVAHSLATSKTPPNKPEGEEVSITEAHLLEALFTPNLTSTVDGIYSKQKDPRLIAEIILVGDKKSSEAIEVQGNLKEEKIAA